MTESETKTTDETIVRTEAVACITFRKRNAVTLLEKLDALGNDYLMSRFFYGCWAEEHLWYGMDGEKNPEFSYTDGAFFRHVHVPVESLAAAVDMVRNATLVTDFHVNVAVQTTRVEKIV